MEKQKEEKQKFRPKRYSEADFEFSEFLCAVNRGNRMNAERHLMRMLHLIRNGCPLPELDFNLTVEWFVNKDNAVRCYDMALDFVE